MTEISVARRATAPASAWPAFFVACIAAFLVSIDGTVLFAAFGALRNGFPQSTAADLSWVLNAYTVVYAALLVPAGRFADALGRVLGWRSPNVFGASAAGLILLAVFVAWSRLRPNPAVDLSLFADLTYRYVNLATLCFGIAFSMMFFAMFFFLMQVWHYSLPRAGLAVSPGPLLVVPVAMVAGRIAARVGHRPLLVVGSLLYAAGGLWLYLRVGPTPDYLGVWLPGLLMTGTAVGMVLPSLSGASVARLAPARFGVGSAINQAVRQMGSVLGVAATVAFVGHASPQVADFRSLYLTHVALALVTAMLCLRVDTAPSKR